MRFFTLETIRDLLREAGLVVVDTKRGAMPLFDRRSESSEATSITRRLMSCMQIPRSRPISS